MTGPLGYGVIGNTADSGSAILGSSPSTPADLSLIGTLSDVLESVLGRPLGRVASSNGMTPRRLVVPTSSRAPSSSGLGRRPLTAVARVRIPSGLRRRNNPRRVLVGVVACGSERCHPARSRRGGCSCGAGAPYLGGSRGGGVVAVFVRRDTHAGPAVRAVAAWALVRTASGSCVVGPGPLYWRVGAVDDASITRPRRSLWRGGFQPGARPVR